tara:strand:+ start:250 stop:654 length:405 start_codon:yes stop_codon:yes gene_type:complete
MANKFHYGNGYNSENSIAIVWSIEDVRYQLECVNDNNNIELILDDDQCMEVLGHVEDCHDAEYGVSWENLYQGIRYCFEEEINEMKKKLWDSFCSHIYTEYLTEKRREQETDIKTLEKYVEDNKEWLEGEYGNR